MSSIVLFLFLLAQQSINSATLAGQVQDSSGAAIANAPVSVINTARNQTSTVTTDAQGRYLFLSLPVGEYRVRVTQNGFAPYERSLTLTVGQSAQLPIQLAV